MDYKSPPSFSVNISTFLFLAWIGRKLSPLRKWSQCIYQEWGAVSVTTVRHWSVPGGFGWVSRIKPILSCFRVQTLGQCLTKGKMKRCPTLKSTEEESNPLPVTNVRKQIRLFYTFWDAKSCLYILLSSLLSLVLAFMFKYIKPEKTLEKITCSQWHNPVTERAGRQHRTTISACCDTQSRKANIASVYSGKPCSYQTGVDAFY